MTDKNKTQEMAATGPNCPAPVGSALQWRPHPERPHTLQGYRANMPEITLFWIEEEKWNPQRGRLLGSFIPDADERSDVTTGLICRLQILAEMYMRKWVESYLSQNTEASR